MINVPLITLQKMYILNERVNAHLFFCGCLKKDLSCLIIVSNKNVLFSTLNNFK